MSGDGKGGDMERGEVPGNGDREAVVVIGATSAIAQACARRWAATGARLFLAGRHAERMAGVAADLTARGAPAPALHIADLRDAAGHEALATAAFAALGRVDVVLIAHGTLPDQAACERDADRMRAAFDDNALSALGLLTVFANRLERQRHGTLAVIASVAGDRGRPSNYVYGAAKAALIAFCSGLRGRLARAGVHVLTIKPGFVDTPMTAGLPLPAPLVARPDDVAATILRAIARRRDEIYAPWFWLPIMLVIRAIPTRLFKRLTL